MAYFTLNLSEKSQQYWWNFKADNHEILAHSEQYTTKQAANDGISSAKKNAQSIDNFRISQTVNQQYYWKLLAANGQTLCHSQTYTTKQSAEHGANRFHELAPSANTKDNT